VPGVAKHIPLFVCSVALGNSVLVQLQGVIKQTNNHARLLLERPQCRLSVTVALSINQPLPNPNLRLSQCNLTVR